MLSIFRRMRKNLLPSGTVRKYLLYALGEIILVMIGILLALQVNTWNNERNLRKKEKVYLQEIRVNLEDDLDNIRFTLEFNARKYSIITQCLETILKEPSNLQIGMFISRQMPTLAEFSVFTQNRVAFDNMVSAENIDIISMDSLRILLSSYYQEQHLNDGTQERVKQLTRMFVDNITPIIISKETINMFINLDNKFPSIAKFDFKTDQQLFGDLFSMQRNLESHSDFVRDFQKEVENLISHIDRFLENRP